MQKTKQKECFKEWIIVNRMKFYLQQFLIYNNFNVFPCYLLNSIKSKKPIFLSKTITNKKSSAPPHETKCPRKSPKHSVSVPSAARAPAHQSQ